MSVNGFLINGVSYKYNYDYLDNIPDMLSIIDTSTVVSRFSDYVTLDWNRFTFTQNALGSNWVNVYIPIEPNKTYDLTIGNSSVLERCGYALVNQVSESWQPGINVTLSDSARVTNTGYAYLYVLIVAPSNLNATIPLKIKENRFDDEIDSIKFTLGDMSNLFYADNCTLRSRFSDYVKMSGHDLIIASNSLGSNYINVYVPLEFGAYYAIDYGDTSGLQLYGMKLSNSIVDATNQGFSHTTEFRNDGSNNAYLVILVQVMSSFAGSVPIAIRKESEKGYVARIGLGYAYVSILAALKGTKDYVELMLTDPVYNVYQEYIDYYGSSFWENYTGYSGQTDMFTAGLWLTGNRKIKGTGSNKVRFQYEGSNDAVKTQFSLFAFWPQYSTVEISDFTIVFSNIRYAVHDDFCPTCAHVIMDGIVFDGNPYSGAVIGAALGLNSTHHIKNCIFLGNDKIYDISYHGSTNSSTSNRCRVYVTNCYGSKGCAFRWYGPSQNTSDCIVSNSKFGSIVCQAYDDQQPNVNMRLIAYCNEETQ